MKVKISAKDFLARPNCPFCKWAEAHPEIYKEIVASRETTKFGPKRIKEWLALNEIELPSNITIAAMDHHFGRGDKPNV